MNFRRFWFKVSHSSWKERFKLAGKVFLVAGGSGLVLVIGIFAYFAKDLPSPGKINSRFVAESTKIYDRTGEHLLYEVHGEEKRTQVSFESMADTIKYATITLEDRNFYNHHGIEISSIFRALIKDVLKRKVAQGGSTITQQFVKNSVLSPERTLSRKIKEVILSFELELKFSKDEILGMYLNEIPYGSNAYGVEAAAQTFFGKSAKELTLDEAALLASLPKAPSYYSPYGSHREDLKSRQEMALDAMVGEGYITETQAEEAKKVNVLSKIQPFRERIDAPHFVMYVKEYIEKAYGREKVEQGGLKVYTTLDWGKQQIAEKAVKEGADKNLKSWNASNSALVAIDPKNGQILAMVGSKDYFDQSIDGQVNVAIRERQPGSSFKPYVYLTAFQKGYTPETMLFDVETNFSTDSGKDYSPKNYDGKFRGPVKMKEALGMSLNIPAVQALYLAGVKESIMTAKNMGVTGLNFPDRYGLSLVLGGGEVKLLDHTGAFGVLATGGVKHRKTAILRVEDGNGKILENYQTSKGERIIEEKYVAMIDHILSTNDYRAPVFGSNSPLRSDERPMAAKTGTTNEFRDGWTIGYTPSLVAGVWSGNNDNSPMRSGADGVNVSAPIWRSFMDQALKNSAIENFPKYEKEETGKDILDGKLDIQENVKVCEIPGEDNKYCLANAYCLSKNVKEKDFANVHTILYYVKRIDPRGEKPSDPERDPQFKNWEKGVQKWYEKKDDYTAGNLPEEECRKEDFSKYLPKASLKISKDAVNFVLKISVEVEADYGTKVVKIYIDGEEEATGKSFEYSVPEDKRTDSIEVMAEVIDKNNNRTTTKQNVSF